MFRCIYHWSGIDWISVIPYPIADYEPSTEDGEIDVTEAEDSLEISDDDEFPEESSDVVVSDGIYLSRNQEET